MLLSADPPVKCIDRCQPRPGRFICSRHFTGLIELLLYFAYVKNSWSWGYPEMFSLDTFAPTNMTWSLPISGNYHMVGACGAFAVEPAGDHDSNVSKSITCEDWESIHRKAKIIKISMWPFIKIPLIPKLWYSNPSQHQAQTSRKHIPRSPTFTACSDLATPGYPMRRW